MALQLIIFVLTNKNKKVRWEHRLPFVCVWGQPSRIVSIGKLNFDFILWSPTETDLKTYNELKKKNQSRSFIKTKLIRPNSLYILSDFPCSVHRLVNSAQFYRIIYRIIQTNGAYKMRIIQTNPSIFTRDDIRRNLHTLVFQTTNHFALFIYFLCRLYFDLWNILIKRSQRKRHINWLNNLTKTTSLDNFEFYGFYVESKKTTFKKQCCELQLNS